MSEILVDAKGHADAERAIKATLVVADSETPPGNREAVLKSVEAMILHFNCEDLLVPGFNVLAKDQGTIPNPRLEKLRQLEAAKKTRAAKTSGMSTRSTTVKEEQTSVELTAEEKINNTVTEEQSGDEEADGVILMGSRQGTMFYGPATEDPTSASTNAKFGVFLDPIASFSGIPQVEQQDARIRRMLVWGCFQHILANHPLVLGSVQPPGDICQINARLKTLCLGQPLVQAMDAVNKMVSLPLLHDARAIIELAQQVEQDLRTASLNTELDIRVGADLLPGYMLAGLSTIPSLSVNVQLLRELRGRRLTVELIAQSILTALAHNPSSASSQGSTALLATGGHGGPKSACFNWRDFGECKYGDACRYSHEGPRGDSSQGAGYGRAKGHGRGRGRGQGRGKGNAQRGTSTAGDKCYECGSDKHGFQDCPERAKISSKLSAQISAQFAHLVATLKPQPTSGAAAPPTAAAQAPNPAIPGSLAGFAVGNVLDVGIGAIAPDPGAEFFNSLQ